MNKQTKKHLGYIATLVIIISVIILSLPQLGKEVLAATPLNVYVVGNSLYSAVLVDNGHGDWELVMYHHPPNILRRYDMIPQFSFNGVEYKFRIKSGNGDIWQFEISETRGSFTIEGKTNPLPPSSPPKVSTPTPSPTSTPSTPDHDLNKWAVYHNEATGNFWFGYPGRDIIRSNKYDNLFHVVHGQSYVSFEYDDTWGIPMVKLLDGGYQETGVETTITIQTTCMSGPEMNDNSMCSGPTPTPGIEDPTPTEEPTPGPTATPEPTPTATPAPQYGNWTVSKNNYGDPVFRYGPLGGYSTSLPWRGGLKAVVIDGTHWFLYVYKDEQSRSWWSISARGSSEVYEGLISELP